MNLPPKSTAEGSCISATLRGAMPGSRRWLFGLLGLALAWYALRDVVWVEVWEL